MDKKEIRKFIIDKRDLIKSSDKIDLDNKIYDNFVNSDYYKNAKRIFTYVSFGSEINTKNIINRAIEDKKEIYVPRVISMKEGLAIHKINSLDDLEVGFYNILEPRKYCEMVDKKVIDFIIMPGVAFDLKGGRIGYGGGFYDRFLVKTEVNVKKIALAYELQILESIPVDQHDVMIDGIITENRIMQFSYKN